GLSGLITPSLDQMVHVASEMERTGWTVPLLIGGATTSKTHTAVKIEERYSGAVVHVLDASRAVGVVSNLLDPARRDAFVADTRAEYARIRDIHRAKRERTPLLSLEEARRRRFPVDWDAYRPPRPAQPGIHVLDAYPLDELASLIDWTPFLQAWEVPG